LGLVLNSGWNELLELNRLAFDDYLPKNMESSCFFIAVKLLKKNAPHIKWYYHLVMEHNAETGRFTGQVVFI